MSLLLTPTQYLQSVQKGKTTRKAIYASEHGLEHSLN